MSNKKGEIKTYSARAVFEYPPNSGHVPLVKEVARHKAGLLAVIGGRVEPSDAVALSPFALGREPTDATFRAAAAREIKEETGGKGSTDPNDGLDVLVGEQIWEYTHDTNPHHVTKVFSAVAVGGLIRPVAHRLGVMESMTFSLEEVDDLQDHGMLRGWQDHRSVHEYWDRREDLLESITATSVETTPPPDLSIPVHLGQLALV